MESSELRVGNLVTKNDEIFVVDFITIQMAHNYNPIPLTEEWLFRAGYTENDLSQGKIIYGAKGGFIITALSNKEIFFVHKLQNLHYELKDAELIIKQ